MMLTLHRAVSHTPPDRWGSTLEVYQLLDVDEESLPLHDPASRLLAAWVVFRCLECGTMITRSANLLR